MPRARQDSEAADVDRGQLFYPSLERRRDRHGSAGARPSRWAGPEQVKAEAARAVRRGT